MAHTPSKFRNTNFTCKTTLQIACAKSVDPVLKWTNLCSSLSYYCKVPKFWDARNLCCNLPKIPTKRPNLRVFGQKDANGIASLIWVCTVCPDLFV